MYDGTRCIWPNCCEPTTLGGATRWLCIEHEQAVVDAHRSARGKRIRKRPPRTDPGFRYPVMRTQSSYWEQKRQAKDEAERRAMLAESEHPGFVYYLRTSAGYKIGWAKRLEQRLRSYSPGDQVMAVHEGSRKDEAALHRRFAHLLMAGREWYPLAPDITRHIELVLEQYGAPDPELHCGPKPARVRRPKHYRDGPASRDWSGGRRAS